eukprot:scaffold68867_cov63-Phaeocystis_antarctica.AAC.3
MKTRRLRPNASGGPAATLAWLYRPSSSRVRGAARSQKGANPTRAGTEAGRVAAPPQEVVPFGARRARGAIVVVERRCHMSLVRARHRAAAARRVVGDPPGVDLGVKGLGLGMSDGGIRKRQHSTLPLRPERRRQALLWRAESSLGLEQPRPESSAPP